MVATLKSAVKTLVLGFEIVFKSDSIFKLSTKLLEASKNSEEPILPNKSFEEFIKSFSLPTSKTVSYTHLTLPTTERV